VRQPPGSSRRLGSLAGPRPTRNLDNRRSGDAFANDIAALLREKGRTVVTDDADKGLLTFGTPWGPRTLDIGVWDENGDLLGFIEAKVGSSPYTDAQRRKDEWLRRNRGFYIDVIRSQ
jgi:hypothetical protein